MPTLSIDIEARLAQFQDGLNRVARDASRTANSIDRAFSGLRSTLGTLVGLAIGGSVIAQLKQSVQELADLNDGATKAGLSVERLSSLLNTLAPTGAGLEQIVDIAGKLTKAMGQAEVETSAQAKAFKALGVSFKDSLGNLRNADDVLVDVAKSLDQYSDGANKVAIAQALLGKTGAEYLPVLGDLATRGRAAATVTKEQAQAADDLSDQIGELNQQFTIFKQGLATAVVPTLSKLIEQFNAGITAAGGFTEALQRYGLRLPKAPGSELADLRARRAELQDELASLEAPDKSFRARGSILRGRTADVVRTELVQLEKDVKYFQLLERQLSDTRQDIYDPRDRAAKSAAAKPQAPGGINAPDAKSALKETAREFEDFEARVNASVARLIQDAPIAKARELESVIGRLNVLFERGLDSDVYAGALEEALTGLVKNGVDASDALQLLDHSFFDLGLSAEAYDKIQKAIFNTTATAGRDGAAGLTDLANRWRDAIDPMRQYARELAEINRLEGVAGGLTPDEAARARADVQSRANKELSDAKDQTDGLKDAAKDLGLTFSSSLEDAIAEGKKLHDVLSGLEQDILRIVTRKLVTEPLANAISGIGSNLFGSLFGGSGAPITASIPTYVKKANGGIVSEFGEVPLRRYAGGGVARSPQAAIFGEGSTPEAYVPLPDGRTIPVTMNGAAGNVIVNVYAQDVESFRRSEGQIKARVAGWTGGAGRFR